MGFASSYLESRALFPEFIKEAPDKTTGIIIVVPAYDEPGICMMLDSLAECNKPECSVEVIIVVNAPSDASDECVRNNRQTLENIESWKNEHKDCFFRLFSFTASPVTGWGVGMARKTGMDEAARRFNFIDRPGGVILNLDADCRVKKNYLTSVTNELLNKKDRSACSIYFEHPLSGDDFPVKTYQSIVQYELHLRYYLQALAYAGFPSVYHTVGSAIAVKALPYVKAGGMNRKQAGEDFYFIQKLIPAGGYFSLNTTAVYPSPRESFRVPFGTGASMGKMAGSSGTSLLTYNLKAFTDLRLFFSMTEAFFNSNCNKLADLYPSLPSELKSFINVSELTDVIAEIKNNTKGYISFRKRYFNWFNMFKVVKYLNFVHQSNFEKVEVEKAAGELLDIIRPGNVFHDSVSLLKFFRLMESPPSQVP